MTEKVAVYNFDFTGTVSMEEFEASFLNHESSECFSDFNRVIIIGGSFDRFLYQIPIPIKATMEATRVEREVFNALQDGSLVCATFLIDELSYRILNRISVQVLGYEAPRVDFRVKRSEFSSLLKDFGSAKHYFFGEFDDIICETAGGNVVAFAKKVGRGAILFLPCYVLFEQLMNRSFLSKYLNALLGALRAYGPKIQYSPPKWISDYTFPKEAAVLSAIQEIENELVKRRASLGRNMKLKEILWFRDDELVDSVINFFKELGIETKRDEIYEEDFWITKGKKESVVVEVKALDKNLKRQHISQLDEHRAAREKPDDFPALLIVNSFNSVNSLKEKDVEISTNEIRKAVQTDVLLLRTLDLCNAYFLIEENKLDTETLLKTLVNEKGWLKITKSKFETIK